jgi:hypothetical protein
MGGAPAARRLPGKRGHSDDGFFGVRGRNKMIGHLVGAVSGHRAGNFEHLLGVLIAFLGVFFQCGLNHLSQPGRDGGVQAAWIGDRLQQMRGEQGLGGVFRRGG